MALDVNPIEKTNGGAHPYNCRIMSIVWTGTTTAGDTCVVARIGSGATIWKGQTDTTNTYQGISLPRAGLHCPDGFSVTCSAGTVLVYLREL